MDLLEQVKPVTSPTQQEWENLFEAQPREVLVLIAGGSSGAAKSNGFWENIVHFLAYVDCETGVLHNLPGRIVYPVADDEPDKISYLHLKPETIYRLKVRPRLPWQVEEFIPQLHNQLLFVETLDEQAPCPQLEEILAQYLQPVVLQDDVLGELDYIREFDFFEGSVDWLGQEIGICLEVEKSDADGIKLAREAMRSMVMNQDKWDAQLRSFAAKELTELARDWSESEEDAAKITEETFAKRIPMGSITMEPDGSFCVFFGDDDMFYGHCITAYGSLNKGLESADIQG